MASNSADGCGVRRTRKRTMAFNFAAAAAAAAVCFFCVVPVVCVSAAEQANPQQTRKLRFGEDGEFKILQVADMHYANGRSTTCLDVLPSQNASCTDLNTTAFIQRMILAEKPNLIVFTGNRSCAILIFHFCFY